MNRIGWIDYVAPVCQATFAATIAGYAAFIAFHASSVWLIVGSVSAIVAAAVLVTTIAAMHRAATEEADVREEIHEENDEEMAREAPAAQVAIELESRLHAVR